MKEKEKGYVYILTNPSFREDWVKIGKSKREVDVRSKELDNTSIPLPFEIYATVKTLKFNEIERNLHKILTKLADARIRKGREFFNIRPEDAFEHMADLADLVDDAELNSPEDFEPEINDKNSKKIYKGKYVVNTDEIFYFYRSSVDAKMKVVDGNTYVVLAGSRIDSHIYNNPDRVKTKREEYKNVIENYITTKDIEFSSPSTAGFFVGGGNVNGKIYWRTKEDKKLEEFIEYLK